ncbi:MAG: hypothetical protein ACE5F1_06735 [Planctomycetota bacterium]
MSWPRSLATCLVLGVLWPPAAAQIRYRVVGLGILPGTRGSQAVAINNRGDVVGFSEGSTPTTRRGVPGP